MAASRIVFALHDLMQEIKALTPHSDEDGPVVEAALYLDPLSYRAVLAAAASHFGNHLISDQSLVGKPASVAGLVILSKPEGSNG